MSEPRLDNTKTHETWDTSKVYNSHDLITYKRLHYRSIISENTGNSPDVSPASWQAVAADSGDVNPGVATQLAYYATDGSTISPAALTTNSASDGLNVPSLLKSGQHFSTGNFVGPSGSTSLYPNCQQYAGNTTITGPGWSLGNAGGWSTGSGDYAVMNTATRGIHQQHAFVLNKHAVGDTAGIYGYINTDGGNSAQSDEGLTAISMHLQENPNYFQGTVVSTSGKGDQAPALGAVTGNAWTTDGAFLINISKGAISGNMMAPSAPVSMATGIDTEATFLNYLPVSAILPVSTTIGISSPAYKPTVSYGFNYSVTYDGVNYVSLTDDNVGNQPDISTEDWIRQSAIPNQQVTANDPVSCSVVVTLVKIGDATSSFMVGEVVTVGGCWYPEQSVLTGVADNGDGTQTLTMKLRNPNDSAIIFQGGIQGQFISFDANYSFSKMRSSYYALGSLTGSDLIYAVNSGGSVVGNTLPSTGWEAARADGGAQSGFHLYPGAEIVANTDIGLACTLEQNGVSWGAGDSVENPHFPRMSGITAWFSRFQQSPASPGGSPYGLLVELNGPGIAAGAIGVAIENDNPNSNYTNNGGLVTPPTAVVFTGSWGDIMQVGYGPDPSNNSTVIKVYQPNAPTDTTMGIVQVNFNAGGNFIFDIANSRYHFDNLDVYQLSSRNVDGVSGSFVSADGKTVTVTGGLITSIA